MDDNNLLVQLNKTGILYGFKEALGKLGGKYSHQHQYGTDGFEGYGHIIDFMNKGNGENGVLAEIIPFNDLHIEDNLSFGDFVKLREHGFSSESRREWYLIRLKVNEEDIDEVKESLSDYFKNRKCPVI